VRNSSFRNGAATADAGDFGGAGSRPRTLATALLRAFLRRPADSLGLVVLAVAVGAIVGNALFFQRGPHPAPIMPAKPQARLAVETTGSLVMTPRARPAAIDAAAKEAPAAVPARTRAQVITDIQRELSQRGYYEGAVDGVFGPKMDAAIREFEQAAGLKSSGDPTEALLRALQKSSAKAPARAATASAPRRADVPTAAPAPSSRIAAVQRALADFGYGQIKPTGVLDAGTKAAIEKFERDRKLPVTGQITDRLSRDLAAVTGRPLQ